MTLKRSTVKSVSNATRGSRRLLLDQRLADLLLADGRLADARLAVLLLVDGWVADARLAEQLAERLAKRRLADARLPRRPR
jgi:hypothetical protein